MRITARTATLAALIVLTVWTAGVTAADVADGVNTLSIRKCSDSVVDRQALTISGPFGQSINGKSFQQDAITSYAGYQYVGYYDADRRLCLARRNLPEGRWASIRFDDYDFKSNDAHNIISIGICRLDGTIHIAFDHHVHPLHYRVSLPGVAQTPEKFEWSTDLFGPIRSELEQGQRIKVTYPRFIQTPDGGLQFCYRRGGSGNGDRMLVDYVPAADGKPLGKQVDEPSGHWTATRQIDSGSGVYKDFFGVSPSRCSYPNGYDYGPDGRLHVTWVWRESSQGANHDLLYAFSPDRGRTWCNNVGKQLVDPPSLNSPGIAAVKIDATLGMMNTHGQAVDSRGRVHAVVWHSTPETLAESGITPGQRRWGSATSCRYMHYWRDTDGTWQQRELPMVVGTRPKVYADRHDNLIMIASSKKPAASAPEGYCNPAPGTLVILAATSETQWTDWRVIHVELGPFGNEMLADKSRWTEEQILSVMVQDAPQQLYEPTSLRVLDFVIE